MARLYAVGNGIDEPCRIGNHAFFAVSQCADTVGGFLSIIMMPFTYSIANGIMFGIIAWVILKVVTGKIKDIHPVMWVSFVLFAVRIVTIIMGVSS